MNAGGHEKHYDLIEEAKLSLNNSGVDDFHDIKDRETGEVVQTGGEILYDAGVLSIKITPDFFAARSNILLDPYDRHESDGSITHFDARPIGKKSKFTPHSIYTSLVERMLEKHSRGIGANKYPRGMWSIEVGFLQPNSEHVSPDGDVVTIGNLVGMLMLLGYDPLLPVRRNIFISGARKEMARIIIEAINSGRSGARRNVRQKLERFAKSISDFVKDYIHGGAKPALDSKTIINRRSKQRRGLVRYDGRRGIYEPLSETQQLEAEVYYRVTGESRWLHDLDIIEKRKKEMNNAIKKEAAKATKEVWKKHIERENVQKRERNKERSKVIDRIMKSKKIQSIEQKEEREAEERDIEIMANRAERNIERIEQEYEYSKAKKYSSPKNIQANETYRQKLRRELTEKKLIAESKLMKIVKQLNNLPIHQWPKEVISENKTIIDAYKEARLQLENMDRAIIGETMEQHGL